MARNTDSRITHGTSNVFADLGFPDPETHLLKASLASRIQDVIEAAGWTQTAAAKRMGIAQPDVSRILRGRFRDYSVERLMRFLAALGCNVEIRVRPTRAAKAGRVHVAAERRAA
jgi:predicted XRE-type DNA-binding protein